MPPLSATAAALAPTWPCDDGLHFRAFTDGDEGQTKAAGRADDITTLAADDITCSGLLMADGPACAAEPTTPAGQESPRSGAAAANAAVTAAALHTVPHSADVARSLALMREAVRRYEHDTRAGGWQRAFAARADIGRLFTDSYLLAIASAPNRSPEKCVEKIDGILAWRAEAGVGTMDPAEPATAAAIGRGAIFCPAGVSDPAGRAVILIRPALMNWGRDRNRDAEYASHVLTIEAAAMRCAAAGPSAPPDFVVCVDAEGCGLRQFDIGWQKQLLATLQRGYPDRLAALVVGPTGFLVKAAFHLLVPLMPPRLRAKIRLPGKLRAELRKHVPEAALPVGWFRSKE